MTGDRMNPVPAAAAVDLDARNQSLNRAEKFPPDLLVTELLLKRFPDRKQITKLVIAGTIN
jgi:hypothetical protein